MLSIRNKARFMSFFTILAILFSFANISPASADTGVDPMAPPTSPSINTEKLDYAAGETALISGTGFLPNEIVTLQVQHTNIVPPDGAGHISWTVTADADGLLTSSWYVNPDDSSNSAFLLTADSASGLHAEFVFADPPATTITLNSVFTGGYLYYGWHDAGNPNYAVAPYIRNFFVFDLSSVSGQITSAILLADDVRMTGSGTPGTYTLFDVSTPIAALEASHGRSRATDADGITIFGDLGSGTALGSVALTNVNPPYSVPLNAAGIVSLNSAVGGQLALGGMYGLTSSDYIMGLSGSSPVKLILTMGSSDTTTPVITYALTPATPDGANDWYKSNVSLVWSVTDPESAVTMTGCVDQNITADQAATTYSCSATSAGGSSGPVDVSIKRDATVPTVSLVGGPANSGSYYFGSVPAAPTCSASDALSGLDGSCTVSGYSALVGSQTVTADAKDLASNQNSASSAYTVLAWTTNGFFQPVDMGGVWNTVKNGSTVPLKFEVFAGSTELTNTSIVNQPLTATQTLCTGGATDDIELLASGETSLRYDATAGQFIYNWQTPKKAGYCYVVTVKLADGTSISANFKLK